MRGVPGALITTVVALAGCGSSAPGTPARQSDAVFAQDCGACHSLVGNESEHKQGGDLLGYQMSREALLEFAREMPVRHALTEAQLAAVVAYIEAAERRAHIKTP